MTQAIAGYDEITGTFTRYGYAINLADSDNGDESDYPLYEAGNYSLESTTIVRPDHSYALDLDKIKELCEGQVKEFAAELGLTAGSASHDLDLENDLDRIYYGDNEAENASQAA